MEVVSVCLWMDGVGGGRTFKERVFNLVKMPEGSWPVKGVPVADPPMQREITFTYHIRQRA